MNLAVKGLEYQMMHTMKSSTRSHKTVSLTHPWRFAFPQRTKPSVKEVVVQAGHCHPVPVEMMVIIDIGSCATPSTLQRRNRMAQKHTSPGEPLEGEWLIDQMADTPLLTHAEEKALGRLLKDLREKITLAKEWLKDSGEAERADITRLLTIYEPEYKALRDKMFYSNIRLVLEIANRMHRLEYMEQVQLGSIGLWRATELFDIDRGNRFSTYATWWIRQAMMRGADETDSIIRLPVHIRDVLKDIRRAEGIYFQETGKEPSIQILSKLTGHTVKKITSAIGYLESPKSLDEHAAMADNDGQDSSFFIQDSGALTEQVFVETEATKRLKQIVHSALLKLEAFIPEGGERPQFTRHSQVLRLRFRINESFGTDEEPFRTLEQVGNEMGITRERARQLQKDAVKWLKVNAPELRALLDHLNGEEK
jgi:RNA polymerase primary sigma factor